jgi:hypothetical protein
MEIINRTPIGLVDALCERIKAVLTPSFWQEAEQFASGENEDCHVPHVHAQYLPISKTASEERDKSKDFPIVQVVCTGGNISDFSESSLGSEIGIQIQFGGYSKDTDNQGWRIPMAMLWCVLQNLLSDTIIGGYKLDTPVKWTPIPGKEPPYYAAIMDTVWKGSPPSIEVPVGIFIDTGNSKEETHEVEG